MVGTEICGDKLQGKGGLVDTEQFFGDGKVFGIYFSAHWCPPCRGFTPELVKFYNYVKGSANGANFEIVFVSMDRDEKSFDGYFGDMPWHAIPYDSDFRQTLPDKYGCSGIPMFVLLNGKDGSVISKDGRAIVGKDAHGAKFPWNN